MNARNVYNKIIIKTINGVTDVYSLKQNQKHKQKKKNTPREYNNIKQPTLIKLVHAVIACDGKHICVYIYDTYTFYGENGTEIMSNLPSIQSSNFKHNIAIKT